MSQPFPDLPEGLVAVDPTEGSVCLTIDAELYPLPALYGAAFVFIDRCYVFLDRPEQGRFRATLTAKDGTADPAALRAVVGEFANELLACAFRHQVTRDNRVLIETVTVQAVAGAMGRPSLDELEAFDFTEEPFEDPLGIAQSWEEKHGRKKGAPSGGEAP